MKGILSKELVQKIYSWWYKSSPDRIYMQFGPILANRVPFEIEEFFDFIIYNRDVVYCGLEKTITYHIQGIKIGYSKELIYQLEKFMNNGEL